MQGDAELGSNRPLRLIRAEMNNLTDAVVGDIELFMNEGFMDEIPRRVFDPARFVSICDNLAKYTTSVMYLVLDSDGHCQGVFVGVIAPDIVTNEMLGTQLVWRVSGESKGFGMKMLEAFMDWCENNGATKIIVAGGHGKERQNKLSLKLRLRGFEPVVTHWMRGV